MITHVPGPCERLARRLSQRFEDWLDRFVAEPRRHAVPQPSARPPVSRPIIAEAAPNASVPKASARSEMKLPAVLRALERGEVSGSVREIARQLNASKSTVQRAKQKLQ